MLVCGRLAHALLNNVCIVDGMKLSQVKTTQRVDIAFEVKQLCSASVGNGEGVRPDKCYRDSSTTDGPLSDVGKNSPQLFSIFLQADADFLEADAELLARRKARLRGHCAERPGDRALFGKPSAQIPASA